ncbi:alpha/beta fold hydrolase [Nocardia sp. IFM 10818]
MTNISAPAPVLTTSVTGSGPAIVLAHGAGGGIAANFGSLIPVLAPQHTVIGSDYPADDTPLELDSLADALVAEAVAAGAEEFTIIGYSLGTAVAVRAAVRHPDRVRGLVLTAGFARADNRARANVELWQRLLATGDRELFARVALLAGFSADFVNAIPADQLPGLLDQMAADVPGGTAAQAALVAAVDITADLPHVAVPTLVIGLSGDLLVDPAGAREQAAAIPGAEYLELPGGHVVMIEQPDRWHAAILEFLAQYPATAAA